MTIPAGTWMIEDVAAELGRSPAWIYKNRARLEAAGFPKPLARLGPRDRLRWRESDVRAWHERRRLGLEAPANDTDPQDTARARINRKLANL